MSEMSPASTALVSQWIGLPGSLMFSTCLTRLSLNSSRFTCIAAVMSVYCS